MSLRELSNTKLLVVLKEKKHLRNMICANTINHIGSALYNVAMFTLTSNWLILCPTVLIVILIICSSLFLELGSPQMNVEA